MPTYTRCAHCGSFSFDVRLKGCGKCGFQKVEAVLSRAGSKASDGIIDIHTPVDADQALLAEIAKSDEIDWTVRMTAVGGLVDQSLLAEVAQAGRDWIGGSIHDQTVRLAAVERLVDDAFLAKVAQGVGDWEVRREALSRLSDQAVLADIARTNGDRDLRKLAAWQITDQNVLAEIAGSDADDVVRRYAAERLTDQAALAEIARVDSVDSVRKAAVSGLTDYTVLAEIATTDSAASVRAVAVGRLTDQALLAEIARNDSDRDVRRAAAEKLTDQAVRAVIALEDEDISVRESAVHGLTAEVCLLRALNDSAESVRAAVLGNPHLTSQEALANVAKLDPSPMVRARAVDRVRDPALLEDIAVSVQDIEVGLLALAILDNATALIRIAVQSEVKAIACKAVERLQRQEDLSTVAATAHCVDAVRLALTRLDDRSLAEEMAFCDDRERRLAAVHALNGRGEGMSRTVRLRLAKDDTLLSRDERVSWATSVLYTDPGYQTFEEALKQHTMFDPLGRPVRYSWFAPGQELRVPEAAQYVRRLLDELSREAFDLMRRLETEKSAEAESARWADVSRRSSGWICPQENCD